MKNKSSWRMVFTGRTKKTRRLVHATALGFFALAGAGHAQSVLVPPPATVPLTPPAVTDLGPGEMQVFPPVLANFLDELNPLQWGPVTLHPHAAYQFTYSTGVQASTNAPAADTIIQTFSPGVLFVYGRHWTLDYTPTFTFYSDKNFQNTVSHAVSLTGGTSYEDWSLGVSQTFNYSSSTEVQTGTQTTQETYGTGLTASHPLNSKMSVDLSLSQSLSFPTGFQSSKQWSTLDWLNYEFWPRLSVGIGAGAGYVIATPNSVFEQVQGRVNWRATDKISFGLNGGAQFTQFTDGGAAPLVNPLFGASIQYLPFAHTQLSLNASETLTTSYYQNQVTENTSVNGTLSQRLFQRYNLTVTGGYNWTSYISAASGADANSPGQYYSINVSLGTTVFKRISTSVFYNYSQNVTSQPGLEFSSNQMGFNVSCAF